jgi:DNA invertase Pin-like site-specific DNA recombinase
MVRRKFVAYYRVSTAKQGASGLGLEAQGKAVHDYLDGSKWEIVAEYTEIESGANGNRPQLTKAFAACRARGAKLVIAKLDRLSRDAHFLLGLQKAGVKFVAVDMPGANEMVVGIMAVMAEGERKMISARTKAALAAAKARGTKLGGWRGGIAPDDEARMASTAVLKARARAFAADLEPIIAVLKAQGATSLGAIAKRLTEQGVPTARGGSTWTAAGVKRVLKLIG